MHVSVHADEPGGNGGGGEPGGNGGGAGGGDGGGGEGGGAGASKLTRLDSGVSADSTVTPSMVESAEVLTLSELTAALAADCVWKLMV